MYLSQGFVPKSRMDFLEGEKAPSYNNLAGTAVIWEMGDPGSSSCSVQFKV